MSFIVRNSSYNYEFSNISNDCGLETPVAPRRRTHASVTNLRSQKRRRSSVASFDLGRELDVDTLSVNENENGTSSVSTKDPSVSLSFVLKS